MTILFGSNSGSCESFAETLASEAPLYGYNATVATLDSAIDSLPNDQPIIIITASYEGRPCENAKQFIAYLESKPKLEINYAVFGAGHHDWVNTYKKIPIYIDQMIENAGGTRILERGTGDAGGDFYDFGQITDFGILLQNKILVKANEIVPTIRHLEIKLPKGQTYRTGYYLAILPSNPIEIVYRGLKRFNLPTDTQVKILSFQLIIQLVHLIF
jgi:cytochrome P450/NADPH-cytochrome P450 reductase